MTRLTHSDVCDAASRIADSVHHTPVLTCSSIDAIAGRRLFFKCENFQRTGSFKYRGATNAILRLAADRAARGVVAYSTGNHAHGLALAARLRGIPANVVVPRTIPSVKLDAIVRHGARAILCEPTMDDLVATTHTVVENTGGVLISTSEHGDVIAGQGTAALELLRHTPDLDAIVCPIGGGGLLAGSCLAAEGWTRELEVFGAEPAAADDAARSLGAGRLLGLPAQARSIADGLLVSLAPPAWDIIRTRAAGIVTVSEEEIRDAMHLVWERMKLVIEPSAAVAVAAVLSDRFRSRSGLDRVGIVLSGGNVKLDTLAARPPETESTPPQDVGASGILVEIAKPEAAGLPDLRFSASSAFNPLGGLGSLRSS